MKTSQSKLIAFTLLLVSFVSCDSNRVYDKYASISDQSWHLENKVSFPFEIQDTLQKNDLFINLRNNNDYGYSNLFLITELNFPDGKKVVDTLEYEMTDVTGRFLGNGFSEIKENKLFYKENVTFPKSGKYEIQIRHAMRKNGEVDGIENLLGVTEVGFRIEKN